MNLARLWAGKILNTLLGRRKELLMDNQETDVALQQLFHRIQAEITPERLQGTDEKEWERFRQKYRLAVFRSGVRIRSYLRAVCAVVVAGVAISFFFWSQEEESLPFGGQFAEGVVLTTETGEVYPLEKPQPGQWTQKYQIRVKEEGREMTYADRLPDSFPQEWHMIRVPARKDYTVILADGTKVILNARSSLRYPSCFVDSVREVWLEGEAYFEVTHRDSHPFVVHFQENRLTVLGTAFNVYCPPGGIARTTLVSGSVSLGNDRESRWLLPGEEGVIMAGHPGIILRKVNTEEAVAWTRNMFYFKNRTLGEIVGKLSDWYGLDVLFQEEELREMVLTVESIRYEEIEEILKIIKTIGRIDYVRDENAILLSSQK